MHKQLKKTIYTNILYVQCFQINLHNGEKGKMQKRRYDEKYDNDGEGWYFRFDYDDKMSYTYNLSIT